MILNWFPGLKKSDIFWGYTTLRPGGLSLLDRSAKSITFFGRRPLAGITYLTYMYHIYI